FPGTVDETSRTGNPPPDWPTNAAAQRQHKDIQVVLNETGPWSEMSNVAGIKGESGEERGKPPEQEREAYWVLQPRFLEAVLTSDNTQDILDKTFGTDPVPEWGRPAFSIRLRPRESRPDVASISGGCA
ncbi:hypothetical protein B0A49_08174, partial [Cryomyces minteri]